MATLPPSAALPEHHARVQDIKSTTIQQRQHSRRSPPRHVASFPAQKSRKLSHSPDETIALNAPITQLKSQSSKSSDQSASHWFDSANQHVRQNGRVTTNYDDEPPFYMTNQAAYPPNDFVPSEGSRLYGVHARLDSENEDLRGIVDDLTVENKRLKQILRVNQRSQRGSPSTENQDRLFEVRMHGLSADKRRELEFLLKNFATSVHTSAPSIPNSTADSGVSSTGAANNGKSKADSGYASNSTSANIPTFNSHPQTLTRGSSNLTQNSKDTSINKYMHNIPDILLPRQQPIMMSERSRMALVVRRLEQLFTGRTAAPGEHSQPLQQQEVSQMAARADANNSKKRKAEGSREAHILPPESKVNFDAFDSGLEKRKKVGHKASDSDMSTSEEAGSSITRPGSPDQRPTRPLDLDIHRAQVADENIQYIRHLGLSSPHLNTPDTSDESWMFLNLLTNMAQLHTINVTPDFVRKSIKKLSTKFELSKDGYKVRWTGGPGGTVFSKEEEKLLEAADQNKENSSPVESNEEVGTSGSSKRSKTDSNSNPVTSNTVSEDRISGLQTSSASKQQMSTDATSNLLSQVPSKPTTGGSTFDYKPIVYRGRQTLNSPGESYLVDSDSSTEDASRESSGLAHALSRSNLGEQRKADEGTITFYNNPFYCSDYSGDKKPSNLIGGRDLAPGSVLGCDPEEDFRGETSRLAGSCYFTPQFWPARFRPSHQDLLPELNLVPLSTDLKEEVEPMEFRVSGLSGVEPKENFAIDVDVHMHEAPRSAQSNCIRRVPITGTEISPAYLYKLGASHKIDLLPSRLPPPSYIFFTSSSSSGNQLDDEEEEEEEEEDDEASGSDEDSTTTNEDDNTPPSFLQRWSADESGNMAEDDLDDSSVDLLAPARAADPLRVAEQERQYLINEPGSRVVAGSLAATVGASPSVTSAGADDEIASNEPEVASDDDMNDDGNDSEMDFDQA